MSDSSDSMMMDGAPAGGGGGVSFGEAIKRGFRGYVSAGWRAPRSEYWFWFLFAFLIGIVANVLDLLLGTGYAGTGIIAGLATLALLLPNICIGIRRLHDTNRSGFWWFIVLIPLVGAIVLLVFFCQRGTVGENRFGPDPLA